MADTLEIGTDSSSRRRRTRIARVGFAESDSDVMTSERNIGIKKLLSIIEMARQEPEAVADRLVASLMGI